jgi:hypothetical protein
VPFPTAVDTFDPRESGDPTIQAERVTALQTAVEALETRIVGATGSVAIGALNAAATTNVTITNSLIVATSTVLCQVRKGSTVAQTGAVATVVAAPRVPGTGSCVVDVTNLGAAATLSTDYVLTYLVIP